MPQLIRTPEDIFRAERRDIYALHFRETTSNAIRNTAQEMKAWFEQHMPDSVLEVMGPSERSGWIEGGPTALRIAFTEPDLQRFCKQWEHPDGKSKDPRFQCCIHPFQRWWNQHGHYMPTMQQPNGPGVSVWIESPLGMLCNVLDDAQVESHPASALDLWANACQQWPALQDVNFNDLHHGQVLKLKEPGQWLMLWNESFASMASQGGRTDADWRQVADWLRLPKDSRIASEF